MHLRAALLVLFLPAAVAAQTPARAAVVAAAADIIQKAHYCTFITIGEGGHAQARVVDPIAPDADFTIWFATNPLTRKVEEVRRNPKVTLSCFDSASSSYVTLLGLASLVTDTAEKQRHWKSDWATIYPNGAKGSDFMLIRIAPERLEIVSESRGMLGDPKTWRPLSVDFVEPRAIEVAKQTSVRNLDHALSTQPFMTWLENLVGAAPGQTWSTNDCGEYPGFPQPSRNFPICAEVEVALAGGRALSISLAVGTEHNGLTDRASGVWWIVITDPDGSSKSVRHLSELPGVIGSPK